jgi:Uncharacterised nucleotidyltransferase
MTIALLSKRHKSFLPDCSAEYQLILACARCQPDEALLNHVLDRYESTLDWELVIQTAGWHGVLPLVYRSLSSLVRDRIPKPVLGQLMKLYLINSAHNQRLTTALERLVELFKTHSIPMMFFKGPVLAEIAYGSVHLRRFSDIDMLIHEKDVPVVRQLLMDRGFQATRLAFATEPQDYLASRPWDDTFTHEDSNVTIDLHWNLMPYYFPVAFDLNRIWQSQAPFTVNQTELYSLNPQDLLLYLCAHGSKELWRHLIWVCDIAEVVRVYPELPWSDLLERAKALGIERMFLLGLALAHDVLDMPLPLPLQAPVTTHPVIQELSTTFKHRILTNVDALIENRETGFWLFHNPLHLKLRDNFRDRLPQYWLTLRFIITPNEEDQQFLALPKTLYPLHYLVRPVRIFYKWMILRKPSAPREKLTPI